MQIIERIVTEMFMMVLCVISAPVDQNEFRISVVSERGYEDTMIIRREEVGFTVYDEMNGELVKYMMIVPKEGRESTFVCTDHKDRSQTIDLSQSINNFNLSGLRSEHHLRLKSVDGVSIPIDHAGNITFITAEIMKQTYLVH